MTPDPNYAIRCYVAGPMRGIRGYNFHAFDAARDALTDQGYVVTSPADLDREIGVDEQTDPLPENFLHRAMRRDIEALLSVDMIVMLKGWQNSEGATFELSVARAIGLDVRFWDPMECVLREGVQT